MPVVPGYGQPQGCGVQHWVTSTPSLSGDNAQGEIIFGDLCRTGHALTPPIRPLVVAWRPGSKYTYSDVQGPAPGRQAPAAEP
jgi:hypothetical protein